MANVANESYTALTQCAVVAFIYHKDKILFLKRAAHKKIDPNKLNGVGGRLEPNEDFLAANIREIEEETGYVVIPDQIKLSSILKTHGGYDIDFVLCIYRVQVDSYNFPKEKDTEDGEFLWIDKDRVLDSDYDVVSGIRPSLEHMLETEDIGFISLEYTDTFEVTKKTISVLR